MNLIKKIIYTGIIILILFTESKILLAQYELRYTQFTENLQIFNPAVAGANETGHFSIFARNQWVSFDSAPVTRSLLMESPVKTKKIGLGLSVLKNQLGPMRQIEVNFDYSYFLRLGSGYRLGLGLKSGFNFYRIAYTDLQTIEADPIYTEDLYKNFLPNFGVGAYLFSENTYLGISVPKIIENKIFKDYYSSEYFEKDEVYFYIFAGKEFKISENIDLKTSSLLRYSKNIPTSVDVSAVFGLKEKFWVGGMYRFNNSLGLITKFNLTPRILFGYSYELTYSFLKTFNNGTHEIMFSYTFDLVNNPNLTAEN